MTSQRGAEFPQRDPKDVPQPRQKRSPNAWAIMPEEGGVPAEVASPTVKTPNKFLKSLINSGKISQADIDAAAEKGAGESLLKRAREALAKQQGGAAATTAGVTGEALDMIHERRRAEGGGDGRRRRRAREEVGGEEERVADARQSHVHANSKIDHTSTPHVHEHLDTTRRLAGTRVSEILEVTTRI